MDRSSVLGRAAGGVVLLATIVGGVGTARAEVLVSGGATTMDTTGADVFWSSWTGCPGEIPSICRVRALPYTVPSPGTWSRDILQNAFDSPNDDDVRSDVAAEPGYAYWADAGGEIIRRANLEQTPFVVSTKEDPTSFGQVAVDDSHVYWTENHDDAGKLFRAPKLGGMRELVYDSVHSPVSQLGVDGTGSVLFVSTVPAGLCCFGFLQRATPGPSGFVFDTVDFQFIDSYAVANGTLYFITKHGIGGNPQLRSAPLSNMSDDVELVDLDDVGDPSWPAMTATSDAVYWQEYRDGNGPIFRYALGGGAPQVITPELGEAKALRTSDEYVFVLAGEAIHRFDRDATAMTLDIVGDERAPEVVQALQNVAHDVPLVDGKRTYVRAFARIAESSEGVSELFFWPVAVLHGSRDGAPLPGSPLPPANPAPLRADTELVRSNLDTTVLFELPESWTHGTVQLEAMVNPRYAVAETDFDNNSASREVTFQNVRGVCLDVLPVLTTTGQSAVTPDDIPGHLPRAKSMYPTDRFVGLFKGGPLRTIPLVNDPYNMFDSSHKDMLLMNISCEFMFANPGTPVECGDAVPIRAAIVPRSDRFGLSHGTEGVIYSLRSFGGNPPHNAPMGGTKGLAHEVGHQMGLHHVNCGGPGWPFETLPYASQCWIDDFNDHVGFDVITKTVVAPFPDDFTVMPTSDFMSYSNWPQWASGYTYRKIFDTLVSGDVSPVSGDGAPSGSSSVIVGYVPVAGAGLVSHAYEATGPTLAEAAAKIERLTQPSADYDFRVLDDAGAVLETGPLNVVANTDEGDGQTLQFYHLVDPSQAAAVEVVHKSTGTVVASRAAQAGLPTVTVTSPVAGQTIGDSMEVTWNGSDPDGDPIAYLVRYSQDGGTTWQSLAADRVGTGMSVDMKRMPGGSGALLEIVASDGLHSTTTVVGPLVVPPRAPQVSISTEAMAPLGASSVASFQQSDTVALQAYGYDAEDGELASSAFVWQVDGPVAHTMEGADLRLWDLPPGSYTVTLEATDSDGQSGTAQVQLEIMPKLVVDDDGVELDGSCGDAAYVLDGDPIRLRDTDGVFAEVRMVRDDGDLYACFNGLPDPTAVESVTLRVDVDGTGGASPAPGDLAFRVFNDGLVQTGTLGADGSFVADAETIGLLGAVRYGAQGWSVELRIDGELLGPSSNIVRVHATHDRASAPSQWPVGSSAATPDSWGLVRLGAGAKLVVVTPEDVEGSEGTPIPLTATQVEPWSDDVTVTWTVEPGAPCTIADPSAVTTTITCADDGLFVATLTAGDGVWTGSDTTRVTVANIAPALGAVVGLVSPLQVGSTTSVAVPFTDAGAGDTHVCSIDWGDATLAQLAGVQSPCQSSHVYALPGLYTVNLKLADDDGGLASIAPRDLAVYDPSAGFVTGAGGIDSPAGALVAQPGVSGTAKFELVAQYKNQPTPHGGVRFKIQSAGFDFRSTQEDWLVLQTSSAHVFGSGTVDGEGDYSFVVAVVDGNAPGGGGVDRLRMSIWDPETSETIYDNQPGAPVAALPTKPISQGSIVIHHQ